MNKLIPGNRLLKETQLTEKFGVSHLGLSEVTKSPEFLCFIEKRAEWQLGIESHCRLVDLLATGRVTEATEELRKHVESHKERLP